MLSRRARDRSLSHRRLVRALPVMITPYAFSTRMSLQSSVRNYFRRNWTNCRMLSKATAQGSVPCVRNTITKTALPTTSSVGTNPTSNPLFFLWQKAWNRRRSISWASAKDPPRSSPRLYAPRASGPNPESSAPSPAGALRHARQRPTANVSTPRLNCNQGNFLRGRASPDSGLITGLLVCAPPRLPRAYALGL
jgi:hypothetical protein